MEISIHALPQVVSRKLEKPKISTPELRKSGGPPPPRGLDPLANPWQIPGSCSWTHQRYPQPVGARTHRRAGRGARSDPGHSLRMAHPAASMHADSMAQAARRVSALDLAVPDDRFRRQPLAVPSDTDPQKSCRLVTAAVGEPRASAWQQRAPRGGSEDPKGKGPLAPSTK